MQKAKSIRRFGLVDCHCFFVFAERLFRPELIGQPVVALSNNDSCALSRSDKAKALGVKMGQPHFQLRDLIECKGLICASSDYPLHQDLCNRVMHELRREAPQIEPYSIDKERLVLLAFRTATSTLSDATSNKWSIAKSAFRSASAFRLQKP
ncbi:hypothetical protein [Pseudomonas panipatensis]|uniref:Y-family DNA polymerase n=1 Tax=Pseudomonas panipatensis TaxID=428992 RepID=UPI000B7DA7C2